MSRVYGRSLPISTKKAVETCKLIRDRSVAQAKATLRDVVTLKKAVPYKRYNQELAHQKNTGSGGYPVAVCQHLLKLLNSVEANASAKGLDDSSLKIVHSCAHLASRPMRYGRKRRVKAKRTHVEIVVKEMETVKKEKGAKKPSTKESKGTDTKPAGSAKGQAEKPTKQAASENQSASKEKGGSSGTAEKTKDGAANKVQDSGTGQEVIDKKKQKKDDDAQ